MTTRAWPVPDQAEESQPTGGRGADGGIHYPAGAPRPPGPATGDIDIEVLPDGRHQQVVWNGQAWVPRGASYWPRSTPSSSGGSSVGARQEAADARRAEEAERQRQWEAGVSEARQRFQAQEAALDRAFKEAENSKDRDLQRYIADQRADLERRKAEMEGWVSEMNANIRLREQNINAALNTLRSFVEARGQDVQQRGQDINAATERMRDQTARLGQQSAIQQYLGDYGLRGTQLNLGNAQRTAELFGVSLPGQYELLTTPNVAPLAPDFRGIQQGLAQQPTYLAPRVAPIPQLPADITGGLGNPVLLPQYPVSPGMRGAETRVLSPFGA